MIHWLWFSEIESHSEVGERFWVAFDGILISDDKEIDRARGIGISSSESEPDSETDEEQENEAEDEEDIYDKDNPRRSGKITLRCHQETSSALPQNPNP